MDNLWFQYNNKREEKGDMLSMLDSLAEYFNITNDLIPTWETPQPPGIKPIYVVFDGKSPGAYVSFESLISQKKEAKYDGGLSWKKYLVIDEALGQARKIIGINYFIEPAAKEYIQMHKKAKNKNVVVNTPAVNIKEEGSSKKPTYKECFVKGVDPLDSEYSDSKLEEKYEKIFPQWKKKIKDEIMIEVKKEMQQQFIIMKKEYDDKFDIVQFLTDEDKMDISGIDCTMDIRGHGQ